MLVTIAYYSQIKGVNLLGTGDFTHPKWFADLQEKLEINTIFFNDLVNEEFYRQYPEKTGQRLTDSPADQIWRQRWYLVAEDLLNKLEEIYTQAS